MKPIPGKSGAANFWVSRYKITFRLFVPLFMLTGSTVLLIVGLQYLVTSDVAFVLSGFALVLLPILMGTLFVVSLRNSADTASSEHPSRFLETLRVLGGLSFVPWLLAVPLLVVVVYLKTTFGQYTLLAAFLELYVVGLNFEFLPLRFVGPTRKFLLRASLKSEIDPERNPKHVWVDGAISYFNAEAHSRKMKVRVRDSINMTVLLFGSEARRSAAIEQLLALSKHYDDFGFISALASLAESPVSQVVERAGFIAGLNRNKGWLFGLAITVLLSYPTFLRLLQTMLASIVTLP